MINFSRILFLTEAQLISGILRHGQAGFSTDTLRYVIRDLTGAYRYFASTGCRILGTTRIAAGPYNLLEADHVVFVDTDGGAITVNLPAGIEGTNYRVINSGTSGNAVVLTPNGAEQLFKAAAATNLYDGEVADIVYNTIEGWQ